MLISFSIALTGESLRGGGFGRRRIGEAISRCFFPRSKSDPVTKRNSLYVCEFSFRKHREYEKITMKNHDKSFQEFFFFLTLHFDHDRGDSRSS